MQDWVVVEEKYLDYLRAEEGRIPYSDYGVNKFKPFFGVLFERNGFVYVTQVSHAQARHQHLKNSLDFHKIFIPAQTPSGKDRLVAVVNLNYMFPVPKSEYAVLAYGDIKNHRNFADAKEESKYIDLLQKELKQINTLGLEVAAKKLLDLKLDYPNNRISKRCIDFAKMEELAAKYISNREDKVE